MTRTLALSLALAACAGRQAAALTPAPAPAPAAIPATAPAPGIPDTQLGLSRTSVFEVPTPPAHHAVTAAAKEAPLPVRPYAGAPPVIPHAVEEHLPITIQANACLDCHGAGPDAKRPANSSEPTPIPRDHYVDLRNAPDRAGAQIAGARWVCTACHVPQTDARPLVVNGFKP